MKGPLKYLALWQKKRNELPVDDDPQSAWEQMRSVLDQQMPVVIKSSRFKGFKMLPSLFIAFSAAAMIYVASNVYTLENQKHQHKTKLHNGGIAMSGAISDSVKSGSSTNTFTDSTNAARATNRLDDPKSLTSSGATNGTVSPQRQDAAQASTGGKQLITISSTNTSAQTNAGAQTATAKRSAIVAKANLNVNKNSAQLSGKNNVPNRNGQSQNNLVGATANNNQLNGKQTGNSLRHNRSNRNGLQAVSPKNHSPGKNSGQFTHPTNSFNAIKGLQTAKDSATSKQLEFAGKTFKNRKSQPVLSLPLISSPNGSQVSQNIMPLAQLPPIDHTRQKPSTNVSLNGKDKKGKITSPANTKSSNLDWGILLGVNSSGSFTPKSQNANFYGSYPVDAYMGLFASFKWNNNWAINPQIRLFSPQSIFTSYSHANQSKVDSGQLLSITATRKIYSVTVPIYMAYNAGNGFHLKAGPVINFPVKQINTSSTLLPYSIRTDTTYYKNISTTLNATQYQQKINFGFSAGASYQYDRWIIEAAYLKSLSGYSVTSGLGSYKSYNSIFQFTIGFQLDKIKLKKSK